MNPRTARLQASRRLGSVRLDPARRVSIRQIDEGVAELQEAFITMAAKLRVARTALGKQVEQERRMNDALQSLQILDRQPRLARHRRADR